jgi:hypothetical protein
METRVQILLSPLPWLRLFLFGSYALQGNDMRLVLNTWLQTSTLSSTPKVPGTVTQAVYPHDKVLTGSGHRPDTHRVEVAATV